MKDVQYEATLWRDGNIVFVSDMYQCREDAMLKVAGWIHARHSFSLDWALKHEGYKVTVNRVLVFDL